MKTKQTWLQYVLLAAVVAPAGAQQAVVAGHSVGRVSLGMSREAVIQALGRPASSSTSVSIAAPHPAGRYAISEWGRGHGDSAGPTLTVTFRDGRAVQIETTSARFVTADGVSVATPFRLLRQRFPRLRVEQYGYDERGGGGFTIFQCDSVGRGIAFTTGTQDEEATYEGLSRSHPDSLIVHPPGRAALATADDPGTRVSVEPHQRDDYRPKIRGWFAGAPHRTGHKGL